MNGIDKLFMVMQTEGAKQNPPRIVLGTMTGAKTCNIYGNDFDEEDLYFAEHLLKNERTITLEQIDSGSTSGGSGESAFASHKHTVKFTKKTATFETTLSEGDLVACYPVTDEKYLILEKVVSG